ncbi:MAG: hypothetical protein ACREU6_04045 [Steroidobacteraceae bacterium]
MIIELGSVSVETKGSAYTTEDDNALKFF